MLSENLLTVIHKSTVEVPGYHDVVDTQRICLRESEYKKVGCGLLVLYSALVIRRRSPFVDTVHPSMIRDVHCTKQEYSVIKSTLTKNRRLFHQHTSFT
jgi:hypothetical protein